MKNCYQQIQKELIASIDEKTKAGSQRFFKEPVTVYGVGTAQVRKIANQWTKSLKGKSKADIFELCDILWQSDYLEDDFIACHLAESRHAESEIDDMNRFEHWVANYVDNWASCDTLCNHTVGMLVEKYPELIDRLKTWAEADNRWLQRAAAVSLIIPARKGLFLNDIFDIADTLLMSPDDLVQKGYGWMLKAASDAHLMPVYDYVIAKKAVMPRTAYRYAIEKMPAEMKKEAMKK